MRPKNPKDFLFFVFPKLRLFEYSYKGVKFLNQSRKNFKKYQKLRKMKLSLKIGIGSLAAFLFIVIVGFVVFPKMIKSKIKTMVALKEGNEIRDLFIKIPFYLDFRIYMFNVTNPMAIQEGAKPIVSEVGPFCFEEWKEKVDIQDNDADDTMSYNQKDTFMAAMWPGCVDINTEITMPHPLILGMVNTVMRQKPGALTLVNKAMKSIYKDPPSIFVTAKAKDILFEGIIINCGVKDFAGKAICSQLRTAGLPQVNDEDLAFSLFGAKNATPGKRLKVLRGINDAHDLGRILQFDEKPNIENWSAKKCNEIHGTDGTIFPPMLTKEEGLASFSPDLCRTLVAYYVKKDKYDGIPVSFYTADLGDASKNADEKCFCSTPDTCLKKGLMDLYKCLGIPIYASLPHFYDCHESYLNGVQGLTPDQEKHQIKILFESTTGSPVYAKKRLQMNMPMEPNDKVDLFNKLPNTVFPLFWIEEGVELNNTFTKPLKDFFKIKKIVKIASWTITVGSLGGIAAAAYLFFKQSGEAEVTTVSKVSPVNEAQKAIHNMKFTMNGEGQGHINSALSTNEIDKY